MKTYKTILMLLLAATTACSKDSAEPDTPGPKPSISMTLDYQSREYELGEVIEATLTITEKNPAADYFLLNTSCNGGTATATVDGEPLQWQAEQQIPYEIVNEEFSSKVLHLKITPQTGATTEQPFSFGILHRPTVPKLETGSTPPASTPHRLQRMRYIRAPRSNWSNNSKSRYSPAKRNSPGNSP